MDVLSNKQKFMEDLESYMTKIGRPIGKSPVMGYKELDLHQLFCEVMAHGGFAEVVKKVGTWARIWKRLDNFDASVTDASYRLKKNYERCLLEYENRRFPDHKETSQSALNSLQNSLNSGTDKSVVKAMKSRGFTKKGSFLPKMDNLVPQTPFLVGDILVENYGVIIPTSPFVTDRLIYPVGYSCSTMFKSMSNPSVDVRYRMQIVDSDGIPQFIISSEEENIIASSPQQAWQIVLAKIASLGSFPSIARVQCFGLDHPILKQALHDLPSAPKSMDIRTSLRSKKKRYSDDSESDEYLPTPKSPRTAPSPPSTSCSSDEEVEKTPRIRFQSKSPEKKSDRKVQPVTFNFLNFGTSEEMDDIELAVHTLTSLKFSISVK